jgi:hypothetical protein
VRDYLRAFAGDLLLPRTDGTVLQFDARGRLSPGGVVPPAFADGSAFTGSPDGRWVASTRGGTVQVYPAREGGPLESIPLDFRAVDLGWS